MNEKVTDKDKFCRVNERIIRLRTLGCVGIGGLVMGL
jgi:hypothetical protein